MDEPTNTTEERGEEESLRKDLKVSRRSVMKAAGASGVLAGYAGVAGAQDECPDCGEAESPGPDLCRNCEALDDDCEFISKEGKTDKEGETNLNEDGCYIGDIPEEATDAVIKAGQQCIFVDDLTTPICVPDGCPGFSHIEFYDCPAPAVTGLSANCDTLTIDTADAKGDTLDVEYELLDGGDLVHDGQATVDDDQNNSLDDSADNSYHIDLSGDTDDTWDTLTVQAIFNTSESVDMFEESSFSSGDEVTVTGSPCNPPVVENLSADCTELTITTSHAKGDTLDVTYELLDGTESVVGPTTESVADDRDGSADNSYVINVGDDTDDTWDMLKVHEIVNTTEGMTLVSSTTNVTVDGSPCNPPVVENLSADCTELTITTSHAKGDTLMVDYELLDGTTSVVDTSESVADDRDGSADNSYVINVADDTDDTWDTLKVHEIVNTTEGMTLVSSTTDVNVTGSPCNPPAVEDLAVNCDEIIVRVNEAASDDTLSVDFDLGRVDEGCASIGTRETGLSADSTDTNDDLVKTVSIASANTGGSTWNKVFLNSITDDNGREMLSDDDQTEHIAVVNNSL